VTTLSLTRKPAAARPLVSLVLPAYNPGPVVERAWLAVRDFVRVRPDPWEAIFVLDGCTDGTADRLAGLGDEYPDPRLRVLAHAPNRGKGFAVRRGLIAARGAVRVFTDVDLAYPFDDIARVADELRHGAAVAIASRDHPESVVQVPAHGLGYAYRRRLQGRLFAAVARRLLPIAQRDTQAGLKGMTAAAADRLLPTLRCDGFGFDCELLTACARLGVPVAEVPVRVRYESRASTTGPGSCLRTVWELWRIRRTWSRAGHPAAAAPAADPAARAA
jgi:glycosyltransferase involved in cell wall biosynthesis